MNDGLVKITPNREKAKSIMKMAEITLAMITDIDKSKFSSNVTKEYYEIIRELISVILLLDGYKTIGEGAHKRMIEYLNANYKQFNAYEISLIDDMRILRNKIAYDGFFVKESYLERKLQDIKDIIAKLKAIIEGKIA